MDTPCVNICLLDETLGLCVGCGRTLEEISRWATMSDRERRTIMTMLPERLEDAEKAKAEGEHA